MKQILILFITLVVSSAVLNAIVFKKIPEKDRLGKIAEVKNYRHPINQITIGDHDRADLEIFDTVLKGKRIVILGESTHQDGKTFQAKSRLIKYFHEKLGFNVVLYEAGQYDSWLMNEEMRSATTSLSGDSVAGLGLYDFWWKNNENKPLIKYFMESKATSLPIELGGFDIQFTGTLLTGEKRGLLIGDFLSKNRIDIKKYPLLNKNINKLNFLTHRWYANQRMDSSEHKLFLEELKELRHEIDELPKNQENRIYSRYIHDIENNVARTREHNAGSMRSMNIRDSLMAENLIFQIDSVYPNQKIIVWCANIHAFSKRYNAEFLPLGAYIKSKYGDRSYMVAFSSYGRFNGQNRIAERPNKNAIENIFHELNTPYFFLDLTAVPESSFLNHEFVSTINQGLSENRKWSSYIDGIFHIDVNQDPTY